MPTHFHRVDLKQSLWSKTKPFWPLLLEPSTIILRLGVLSPAVWKFVFQFLSHIWLFATPWTAARQAPKSSTISWILLKFMSIEPVMLSNYIILCHHLLLLPSVFPSIRSFPMGQHFASGGPKYWKFSFSSSNEYSGLISFRIDLFDLLALSWEGLSRVFSSTPIWKHQFFSAQASLWSNSHIHTWLLEKS